MAKNIKQVYDANPSTTLGNNDLLYAGLSPYGVTNDSAIKYSDLFAELKTGLFFSSANTVWADPNGNNSNSGIENSPFADPFAASNSLTGTVANPKLVNYNSGKYSTTSFSLKPNVSLQGNQNSVLTVTNPITLDSTWTTAAAGTKTYLSGVNSTNGMSLDWSAASLGGVTVLEMFNCTFGDTSSFIATTGHKPTILIEDCRITNPVFQSIVATIRNLHAVSTLVVEPSAGGGSTNITIVNSYLPVALTITGASGSSSTVTIQACTNISTLVVDSTFVTLLIDEASYPTGGITYSGGATSAQVSVQRGDMGSSIPFSVTAGKIIRSNGTNYIPSTATYPDTAGTAGNLMTSDGTNFVSSAPKAQPNILIGGNFDTNPWQRNVTFTSVANATYTADRFAWYQVGTGVINITKTADAPSIGSAGILVSNCLSIPVTTADASIASTDKYNLTTFIEGIDWAQAAQQALTLTFWVKSTKTGTFCISCQNSGLDRTFIAEYTVNSTNTWELKTISIAASPSAGTWSYTAGTVGLFLNFTIAAGSNFQGSTGWTTTSGTTLCTSNQVNGMDSNTNTFKLALIKLEIGTNATAYPFEPVERVQELCQRFYETSQSFESGFYFPNTDQTGGNNWTTPATGTGAFEVYIPFKVRKSIVPTITLCDNLAATGKVFKGAAGKTANSVGIGQYGFNGGTSDATSTNTMYFQFQAVSELF